MAARIILTKEQFTDAVTNGYEDGLSFSEIASLTGRSRSAVAGKAHRLGLCSRGPGRRPQRPSAASLALGAKIAALHAEGLTTTEIGIALGIEGGAVRRRLHLASLKLNRPKPGARRSRPTHPDTTPPAASGALVYRAGPVDLTPPETATWFADGKGCRFSCWPTTEKDPFAKRCCGAVAVRGSYCAYHASIVYAPATSKRAA